MSPDSVGLGSLFKVTVGLGRTKAAGERLLLSGRAVDYLPPPALDSADFLDFDERWSHLFLEPHLSKMVTKMASVRYLMELGVVFLVRILLPDQLLKVLR